MPSIWLPERVVTIHTSGRFASQILLSDISVDPVVIDDDFSVTMPPGTQVDDHVAGMRYIVSEGPVEEARAIDEFLKTHKVVYPVEALDDNKITIRLGLVLVNAIAFIAFGLWYVWKRKRHVTTITLLCLMISHSAQAEEWNQVRGMHWDEGWWYSRPELRPVQITQCGFNVAATTLRMLNLPFDPNALAESMPPTLAGITATDLTAGLRSHGAEVDPRVHVPLKLLVGNLLKSELVIVPVKPRSASTLHYVILSCLPDGRKLLLDPTHRAVSVDHLSPAIFAENSDLTVLYVSKQPLILPTRRTKADSVSFSPSVVEVGSENDDRFTTEVVIHNSSANKIQIEKFVVSCSCVQLPESRAQTLAPNESTSIRAEVNRSGIGSSQIQVLAHLSDGSTATFAIRAPPPPESSEHSIFSTFRVCTVSNRESEFRDLFSFIHIPSQWSAAISE